MQLSLELSLKLYDCWKQFQTNLNVFKIINCQENYQICNIKYQV